MSEQQPGRIERVIDGYTFEGASVELGVLMEDDEPTPAARVRIPLTMLNRHGLVAGATGTGKTRTLQLMAEQISAAGVPVFAPDIKGDLSGIAIPGTPSEKLLRRTEAIAQTWQPQAAPAEFFSIGGRGTGIPLRATVTSFGPLLLSKVLGLNQTQESSLGLVFHYADSRGLALLDLKDLRALLTHLTSAEGKAELKGIGGVSSASVGVILRNLIQLETQGGDVFFGEPEFDTADLMRTTSEGRGVISLLELPDLSDRPVVFSTFLMWLLADLFRELPEIGDTDKPRLVFFFDEAHLLFSNASRAFLEAVAQTVRLIRSKGVGIFFVTQAPQDLPDEVLAQLGSKIQHQLRAHTPRDADALRETVRTYPFSDYDLTAVLQTLGTGEAVVTVLNPNGAPTPVAWTRMLAPQSSMEPMNPEWLARGVAASALQSRYGAAVDRESAYELLTTRLQQAQANNQQTEPATPARAPRTGSGRREKSGAEKVLSSPGFWTQVVRVGGQVLRGWMGTARR